MDNYNNLSYRSQTGARLGLKKLAISLWLIFTILIFASLSLAINTKQVFVLHSYHKGLSWTDSLADGIEDTLQQTGIPVEISHEFMDTKKLFTETYLQQLQDLYRKKFSQTNFDLIISTDDHAFQFLRKNHKDLFPGVPAVFCGVNNFSQDMLEDLPEFTGVVEAFDIPGTMELVLKLHPEVTRFVLIGDQSLTGRSNKILFIDAMGALSKKLNILSLDDHTMEEVRQEVSKLTEKDVAFWLTFTADRAGQYFSFRKSATLIAEKSAVPVYSFWDFHLGYGITGGRVASGYYQGKTAAELGVRILQGEPVASVPVITKSPNQNMFDHTKLEEFGIDTKKLPPNSIVINQPQSFYNQYKSYFWGIVSGFIALALIIILLMKNIFMRKAANKEITRAKNRFQRIFNDASIPLFVVDFSKVYKRFGGAGLENESNLISSGLEKENRIDELVKLVQLLDCNKAALLLYETEDKEKLLSTIAKENQIFSNGDFGKVLQAIITGSGRLEWESTKMSLGGKELHCIMSVRPGNSFELRENIIISMVDITERENYVKELQRSEDRFRTLFDNAGSGIALLDINGNYMRVNGAFAQMLGYTVDELELKSWREVTHPDDTEVTQSLIDDLLTGKTVRPAEKRYIHRDGKIVWGLLNVGLNVGADGKPLYYVAQLQDISRMKAVQSRMQLKDERYRQIFEADLSGFYIANPSGKVLICNQVFAEILGFTTVAELIGRNISPYYRKAEAWQKLVGDLWDKRRVENTEVELLRSTGESINVLFNAIGRFDDQGQLIEIQGHMMDISKQKKLESQLFRAQKMEAIGLMAGGVAHDLNNILSGIISYPDLMLSTLDADSSFCKPLSSIKESGQRAAAVVADLLTVARGAANVRELHYLTTIAKEYLDSPECTRLRSLHPEISLHLESDAENDTILCSPVHIKKCAMNLVTNAMEAIEGSGKVVVVVSEKTITEVVDEEEISSDYVLLTVHDSGPGISEGDKERIFEPFYTKKVMGRSGTGLGLAVVWNTVQDHGGKVKVESTSQGTTFTLYFPKYEKISIQPELEQEDISITGNGEHILVVDDEPVIRDIATQILTNLGYKVDDVESGEQAMAFLNEKEVDLVLLDMFMDPGINGCITYERIIRNHPGQKAIIASGFSKSDDVKKALRLGVGAFIEKPYSIEQLGRAVAKELMNS